MPQRTTDWESAYLRALGAPDTPQNRKFLASWQRWEGGHTNNDARYNYLNTTQQMQGSRRINSVGVQSYTSLAQGAKAFARTLRNGHYGDLLTGLRSGNPYKTNVAAGLSVWVSGDPNSASGHAYASKVLGTKVTPPPVQNRTAPGTDLPTAPPDLTSARMDTLDQIASGHYDPMQGLQALTNSLMAQGHVDMSTGVPQPAKRTAKVRVTGSGYAAWVPGHTSVGGIHPTKGLAGYPARDVFGKPGTPVVSPVNGTVIKVSGHDPKQGPIDGPHGPLGWSAYIKDQNGHVWYVTHLGTRAVKVGEKISRGAEIGTIANYDKYGTPSHAHVGRHG